MSVGEVSEYLRSEAEQAGMARTRGPPWAAPKAYLESEATLDGDCSQDGSVPWGRSQGTWNGLQPPRTPTGHRQSPAEHPSFELWAHVHLWAHQPL